MSAIRDSTGLSTIGGISVRDSSGMSTISTGSIRDTSGLSIFFSIGNTGNNSLTPSDVEGFAYSRGLVAITTEEATVSAPSGASITWNFSPSLGWSAVSPTAATTQFRRSNVGPGESYETVITATVVSGSTSFTSNSITANVQNNYVDS